MANRQGVLSDRKFGFWNDAEPISKWSQWPNSAEPLIAVAIHQVSEVLKAMYGRNWAHNIWADFLT